MRQLVALRTFLEAFRTGSLSRAAARLNITQSVATTHIQQLENTLGKPLFERHARGVRPTPMAQSLAQSVAGALDALETAFATAQLGPAQKLSGTVHLIAPGEFAEARLAPALAALTSAGLTIRLGLAGRAGLFEQLARGNVDLAITASTPEDDALDAQTITTEEWWLVGAPRWVELAGVPERLPLVAYDLQLPLLREYWRAAFRKAPAAAPLVTVPDLRAVRALCLAGIGVSVLPDYLARTAVDAGSLVRLHTPRRPLRNKLYLVWNRGALRHPRVVFARDRLLEHFRST